MEIFPPQITYRFKFKNDDLMPASATLILGQFEIRGFAIRKSKIPGERFAFYPPAQRSGSNWLKIFFTKDKKLWKQLEKEALKAFNEEHDAYLFSNMGEAKEVTVEF